MRWFPSLPWDLPANFMRVGQPVVTRSLCATFKAVALVETEQIRSEYWNNINFLMSKSEPFFQKSKSALFNSLTIFYCFNIHALIPKPPLGFACLFYALLRQPVVTRSLCATFKAVALVETEQIRSEYWNNRNFLMSKNEPFFQKSKSALFSSLTIFLLFQYSCVDLPCLPWDLPANFMRVRQPVVTRSLFATFKAVALVETEQIASEY